MPLIVAIEPDPRQAAQLKALARGPLRAKLIVVDSTERAIEAIDERVPDLILTSALLSPREENALADRLRTLDAAAAHVQTLTIPVFAAPVRARSKKGVLSRLRRPRKRPDVPEGCDPNVFAEQIAEYLERAAAERALTASATVETTTTDRDQPAPEHDPAASAIVIAQTEEPGQAEEPAQEVALIAYVEDVTGSKDAARPIPLESISLESFALEPIPLESTPVESIPVEPIPIPVEPIPVKPIALAPIAHSAPDEAAVQTPEPLFVVTASVDPGPTMSVPDETAPIDSGDDIDLSTYVAQIEVAEKVEPVVFEVVSDQTMAVSDRTLEDLLQELATPLAEPTVVLAPEPIAAETTLVQSLDEAPPRDLSPSRNDVPAELAPEHVLGPDQAMTPEVTAESMSAEVTVSADPIPTVVDPIPAVSVEVGDRRSLGSRLRGWLSSHRPRVQREKSASIDLPPAHPETGPPPATEMVAAAEPVKVGDAIAPAVEASVPVELAASPAERPTLAPEPEPAHAEATSSVDPTAFADPTATISVSVDDSTAAAFLLIDTAATEAVPVAEMPAAVVETPAPVELAAPPVHPPVQPSADLAAEPVCAVEPVYAEVTVSVDPNATISIGVGDAGLSPYLDDVESGKDPLEQIVPESIAEESTAQIEAPVTAEAPEIESIALPLDVPRTWPQMEGWVAPDPTKPIEIESIVEADEVAATRIAPAGEVPVPIDVPVPIAVAATKAPAARVSAVPTPEISTELVEAADFLFDEPSSTVPSDSESELWMALPLDLHRAWPRLQGFVPIADSLAAPVDQAAFAPRAQPGPVSRKKKGRKTTKPVQDEWGFFDPNQCGFAALVAKLDEISEPADNTEPDPPK